MKKGSLYNYLFSFLIFSQILDTVSVFSLRLYQWAAIFIVVAFLVGFLKKDKTYSFNRITAFFKSRKYFVILLLLLLLFSLVGLVNSPNLVFSFKQTIVLSFSIAISFLVSFWVFREKPQKGQTTKAVKLYMLSSVPVALFAIYQNIAHEYGWQSFEVMPARPNAFFYEPDWLGIYCALVLSFLIPFSVFIFSASKLALKKINLKQKISFLILILLNIITLIISVARSGWLGILAGVFVFAFWAALSFYRQKISQKEFSQTLGAIFSVLALTVFSLLIISGLNLTRFNLKDRFQSIYKGEHIITVAQNPNTGEKIKINLEEIAAYQEKGYQVSEEKTADENIDSRYSAYSSNWEMTKEHWLLGQGQGSVAVRTNFEHNANNLFFEWWISGGLTGLAAFTLLLYGLLKKPWYFLRNQEDDQKKENNYARFLFNGAVLMGTTVIVITNLFNSGICFIPMWVFIGLVYGKNLD